MFPLIKSLANRICKQGKGVNSRMGFSKSKLARTYYIVNIKKRGKSVVYNFFKNFRKNIQQRDRSIIFDKSFITGLKNRYNFRNF
jgi:hypothetical protein